jgi:hypothetical protein
MYARSGHKSSETSLWSTGRVEQWDKAESFLLKSGSRPRWDDDETWIRDTVREDRNKSVLDLFTFWARKAKVEDRILFFVARKGNVQSGGAHPIFGFSHCLQYCVRVSTP